MALKFYGQPDKLKLVGLEDMNLKLEPGPLHVVGRC